MNQSGFPRELLDQPPEVRLHYFKSPGSTIMHKNLKIAFNQACRSIREPAGASIILIIGPSGVGKTTLLLLLTKKILEESLEQMLGNPAWIPIVCVEAPAPGKGSFRWKPFYKDILIAVDEPGIDYKINYESGSIRRGNGGKIVVTGRATEDSLRLAMENALIHRKPYTLAVDEFQHIGKMAGEELLQAHMDCVKSVVNVTKVPWTGFGTYQLLDFLELSPQLSRRTKTIHFPRYDLRNDADIKEFKRVLQQLQYQMPLAETPRLKQEYWEFCYERSIGNIGTLITWLTDAYDLCLSDNGGNTLTLEHLKATAKSASECQKMASDAIEGEEKLTDSDKKSNDLRKKLGFDIEETKKHKEGSAKSGKQLNNNSKSRQTKQPFKRKATRDPVGG